MPCREGTAESNTEAEGQWGCYHDSPGREHWQLGSGGGSGDAGNGMGQILAEPETPAGLDVEDETEEESA